MTDLRQRLGELDQLDAPDMRASIDQRAAELDQAPQQSLVGTSASGWRGPLIAVGTAFVILIVVAGSLLLIGRDDSGVVEEPTTTVVSTTLPPTTMPSTTIPPAPTTVPSTTVAAEAVAPYPPFELPVLEVPLSEAVPGFSDTIVWTAVSESSDDIFQTVFRLRPSESIAELLLPSEDELALGDELPWRGDDLDASANWVADVSPFDRRVTVDSVPTVPGEPSRRAFVGNATQGAAVWHDTEPGHLAWLECPNSSLDSLDGPTTLVTLDVSDPSADPIRLRLFDQGCRTGCWGADEPCVTLARWGSTGVWPTMYPEGWEAKWHDDTEVQNTEGQDAIESVLVDADGTEIATVSTAQMIAMRPDGTTVWQSDNWQGPHFVLSPDGQQRSTLPGLYDGEPLGGAWWSPNGTRLTMWLSTGLRTVDPVSGEIITEIPAPATGFGLDAWGASVAWSTDSRFLVYESFEGEVISPETGALMIHDTATNTTTKIPHSGDVADIRLR